MENVIFIPRGMLREPAPVQEEEKKVDPQEESKEESKGEPFKDKKMQSNWSCGLSRSQ